MRVRGRSDDGHVLRCRSDEGLLSLTLVDVKREFLFTDKSEPKIDKGNFL